MKKNRIASIGVLALLITLGSIGVEMSFSPQVALATAPTLLTSQTPKGPYPGTVASSALTMTLAAADASNGNSFTMTGHDVLIMYNSDASPHTVTLTSVPDQRGRTSDVTAYSIAATTYAMFNFRAGSEGWQQSNGTVIFTASDATVKFAVLYIP